MPITNIENLSDLVSTSVAAYGILDSSRLADSLTAPVSGAGFSVTQANNFEINYSLLHQLPNTATGLSAALFEDQTTGKKVLALRGTEFTVTGFYDDLFIADILGIGGVGYANSQAVDLYMYWKQLITPVGQAVVYTDTELVQLFALSSGLGDALPNIDSIRQLPAFIDIQAQANSSVGLGLVDFEQVDVTGHSLGGHLAYLFDRFFPNYTDQVVTLNAPGFYQRGDERLTAYGFPPQGDGHITAVVGEGDGINILGNIHPGIRIDIAQESSLGPLAAISSNHSSINGADSLALMNAFGLLDTTLVNETSGLLSDFIRQSANASEASYETLLDALRVWILGNGITPTSIASGTNGVSRESFYANLNDLVASTQFQNLVGNVSFTSMHNISPNLAAQDTDEGRAYRFALVNLLPFAITTNVANTAANHSDYDLANFTTHYLQDRADYLAHLLEVNRRDELPTSAIFDDSNGVDTYRDLSSGEGLTVHEVGGTPLTNVILTEDGGSHSGTTPDERRFTIFGSDADEDLEGNQNQDRLYGMAGDDVLDGGEGNDYLEGGVGDDEYRFDYGDGRDRIVDNGASDDANALWLTHESGGAQTQVTALTLVADSDTLLYVELDGNGDRLNNTNYLVLDTPTTEDPDHQSLLITVDGGAGGTVLIEGWGGESNAFGITLNEAPTVDEPEQDNPYTVTGEESSDNPIPGDRDLIIDVTEATGLWPSGAYNGLDEVGNEFGAYVVNGGDHNDRLLGGEYQDQLHGGEGDDFIETGGGEDATPNDGALNTGNLVSGGLGSDHILGSEAEDYIWGNTAYKAEYDPISQNYTPPDEALYTPESANSSDFINAGGGADDISADEGNDVVLAGTGDDFVMGGEGADVLAGEAGDDYILGDSHARLWPGTFGALVTAINRTTAEVSYDDTILGGEGDDRLVGEIGNDTLSGDAGNDILWGDRWHEADDFDHQNPRYGLPDGTTSPDDSIRFTQLPTGFHGDDTLSGGAGEDTLIGNGGSDTLYGGDNDDNLLGDGWSLPGEHHQDDYLDGGRGGDLIFAGGGNDVVYGGEGNDTVMGDDSDGTMRWLNLPDSPTYELALDGQYHGDDVIDGGAGRDNLFGDGGNDTMMGIAA